MIYGETTIDYTKNRFLGDATCKVRVIQNGVMCLYRSIQN